jgi:DNA-binding NtrC family response regulator
LVIKNKSSVTRLLVVSGDEAVLRPLWSIGDSNGWLLEIAADPWEAIDRAQSGDRFDMAVLDLPRGSGEGLHSLRWLRRLRPDLPVIMIGHHDDNGRKQESMRIGARVYLVRPITDRQMESAIRRQIAIAQEDIESEDENGVTGANSGECFASGVSPIMQKLRAEATLLAESDVPVLILGDDAGGKQIVARLIHSLSARAAFEFARINCAALPPDLLERELFGCESKGLTAPARMKTGKLELCAKGTIFLDEIAALTPKLQSGVLQVVENKGFFRPGSAAWVDVDVRMVAAGFANRAGAAVARGLESELYRKLRAHSIRVPSLRERKQELSFLSRDFMHRLARHYGLSPREFSPAFIEAWQSYHWQGNSQELERRVIRYLGETGENALRENHAATRWSLDPPAWSERTSLDRTAPSPYRPGASVPGSNSLRSHVQEAERSAIAAALEKTGWNRKAAARLLKVSYRSVLYKIDQYRIAAPRASATVPADHLAVTEAASQEDGRSNDADHAICFPQVPAAVLYER